MASSASEEVGQAACGEVPVHGVNYVPDSFDTGDGKNGVEVQSIYSEGKKEVSKLDFSEALVPCPMSLVSCMS
jgi:hypothetical protein